MAVSMQKVAPAWSSGFHSIMLLGKSVEKGKGRGARAPLIQEEEGEGLEEQEHVGVAEEVGDLAIAGSMQVEELGMDSIHDEQQQHVDPGKGMLAEGDAGKGFRFIGHPDRMSATGKRGEERDAQSSADAVQQQSPRDGSCRANGSAVMAGGGEDEEGGSGDDEDEEDEAWEYAAEERGYGVDPRDEGTADGWVRRHPEMIRLTGRHPFNSEPPLARLMQHGFITPASLHYVRNHGYVPATRTGAPDVGHVSRSQEEVLDEWKVEVCGDSVARPQSFSVRQLMEEFPRRELPVTLVCAGNRRKEVNMVKQTKGFNWGPGGVGTSVWRGARLCDVLRRCGVRRRRSKGRQYVCFEGAEKLPGGGGGPYGTSVGLEEALDESRDVLVAYLQNGALLLPDHGFPVRVIIPGYIGGRMVKWLARIHVSSAESPSHYHYNDNRLLPSHLDIDLANAQGWWYKPDYIINELNVNSVITSPAAGEIVPINLHTPYTARGYAYSGGGRKVIRVEVSMNEGQSWKLTKVSHPAKPTKYGKYWCWCFWEVELDFLEMLQSKELVVRAWDSSMNTQPEHLNWNCMGFMNNCWYRLKVNPCKARSSSIALAFEHPTSPGNQSGGWMTSPTDQQSISAQQQKPLSKSPSTPLLHKHARAISMAELKQHKAPESLWIAVYDSVYDCTKFLDEHPGGRSSILLNGGTDCTEEFDAIHSSKAKAMLEDYKIGDLVSQGGASNDSTPDSTLHNATSASALLSTIDELALTSKPVALNPRQKIQCKLVSKQFLSHDVRLFRFALPHADQVLGLPVGKHIFVLARIDGKLCMRAYTPTSSNKDEGYFELLIKVYFKEVHSKFPLGGSMSQHLESLAIGDTIEVKGPLGHIEYLGNGAYKVDDKIHSMKYCAMVAGGTGITPMYQLIREILENPDDKTEICLIFANRREEDIMLRKELDKWREEHPQLKVWYVLSAPPSGWLYGCGHINKEVIRSHFPPPSLDTSVFLCGPSPMIEQACLPNLDSLGFLKDLTFIF